MQMSHLLPCNLMTFPRCNNNSVLLCSYYVEARTKTSRPHFNVVVCIGAVKIWISELARKNSTQLKRE